MGWSGTMPYNDPLRRTRTSDPVELASALEEALENGDRRFAQLQPFLVRPPQVVSCVKGGFEIEVVVFARHRNTAFFASLEATQFGVGEMNAFGDIIASDHYTNIT